MKVSCFKSSILRRTNCPGEDVFCWYLGRSSNFGQLSPLQPLKSLQCLKQTAVISQLLKFFKCVCPFSTMVDKMNRRNSGKKNCSCAHNLPFMWISVCWMGSRNPQHENQHPSLISFSSCCDSSAAGCYQLWKKLFSCFCVSNYLMASWLIWQNKVPAVVMDVTVRERKVPAEKELEQRGW